MREIKFRAWDKKINQMVQVMTISFRCGHIDCVHHAHEHKGGHYLTNGEKDYVLMQYTGLKDTNGREIYEGDILSRLRDIRTGTRVHRGYRKGDWYTEPVKQEQEIRGVVTFGQLEIVHQQTQGFYVKVHEKNRYQSSWRMRGINDRLSPVTEDLSENITSQHEIVGNIHENPGLLTNWTINQSVWEIE